MTTQELVPLVKSWLRISAASVDAEMEQTIDACVLDLKNAGAVTVLLSDTLIQQAVKLYCKAQFGFDKDAEKFGAAYEHLKAALALSGDYNQ